MSAPPAPWPLWLSWLSINTNASSSGRKPHASPKFSMYANLSFLKQRSQSLGSCSSLSVLQHTRNWFPSHKTVATFWLLPAGRWYFQFVCLFMGGGGSGDAPVSGPRSLLGGGGVTPVSGLVPLLYPPLDQDRGNPSPPLPEPGQEYIPQLPPKLPTPTLPRTGYGADGTTYAFSCKRTFLFTQVMTFVYSTIFTLWS